MDRKDAKNRVKIEFKIKIIIFLIILIIYLTYILIIFIVTTSSPPRPRVVGFVITIWPF